MHAKLLALCLASVCLVGVLGCATVAPSSDPVTVNAERSLQLSFETVDAFLRLDAVNRDWSRTHAAEAHRMAEWLRANAPAAFKAAAKAIAQYKRDSTASNKVALQAGLIEVSALAAQANSGMLQLVPPK